MALLDAIFTIVAAVAVFIGIIRAINFLSDITLHRMREGFERKMRELDQARMPVDDMVDVVAGHPRGLRLRREVLAGVCGPVAGHRRPAGRRSGQGAQAMSQIGYHDPALMHEELERLRAQYAEAMLLLGLVQQARDFGHVHELLAEFRKAPDFPVCPPSAVLQSPADEEAGDKP